MQALKAKHIEQVALFDSWSLDRKWGEFHRNHYDWWAFPIDQPSSFGFKYTVTAEALAELQNDAEFIGSLQKAAKLLFLSWGWDIHKRDFVDDPDPDQAWADWPIRLAKCNRSLKLFELSELVESTVIYSTWLLDRGESFSYNGRDLYPEIIEPLS